MRRAEPDGGDRRLGEWWGWGTKSVAARHRVRPEQRAGERLRVRMLVHLRRPSQFPAPTGGRTTPTPRVGACSVLLRGYMALVRTAPLILRLLSGRTVPYGWAVLGISHRLCCVRASLLLACMDSCCDCDQTACSCACALQAAAAPSNVRSRGQREPQPGAQHIEHNHAFGHGRRGTTQVRVRACMAARTSGGAAARDARPSAGTAARMSGCRRSCLLGAAAWDARPSAGPVRAGAGARRSVGERAGMGTVARPDAGESSLATWIPKNFTKFFRFSVT